MCPALSRMEGAVGYDSVLVTTCRKSLKMHTATLPRDPQCLPALSDSYSYEYRNQGADAGEGPKASG